MHPADLAPRWPLIGEFVERLGLADVTLAQNDWGGAQVLVANGATLSAATAQGASAALWAVSSAPSR